MSITTGWFDSLQDILSKSIDDESKLRTAIGHIFSYVELKHCGRCTSKKIFIEKEREKIIAKFCTSYFKGITPAEICQTKLMRKFAKHNEDNAKHYDFIYPRIVNAQLDKFPNATELTSHPTVLSWMLDFNQTILDPATLEKQKKCLGDLPPEYATILTTERARVGPILVKAIGDKLIGQENLLNLVKRVSLPCEFEEEPSLTESAEDYFAYHYQKIIAMGGPHAEAFKNSLAMGLENLSRSPDVTGKAFSEAPAKV